MFAIWSLNKLANKTVVNWKSMGLLIFTKSNVITELK